MTAKEWREKWLVKHGTTHERLRQTEARPDVSRTEDLESNDLDNSIHLPTSGMTWMRSKEDLWE